MIKNLIKIVLISCLILTVNIGYLFSQEVVGKVIALEGKVEAKLEDSQSWRLLDLKGDVYEKDTIRTGEDSQAEIFFVDESTISIGPETTIRIEKLICSISKNHREGNFDILTGKARFDVGRLFSKDSTFEVKTPTAVAGVKGTSFVVWVTSEQLTQLLGLSGSITVRSILSSIEGESLLARGFIISVADGAPPGDPIPVTFEELLDFLKNLGSVGRDYKGIKIPRALLRKLILRGMLNKLGQSDVIDQPIKTEPGDLPEPPQPPEDIR